MRSVDIHFKNQATIRCIVLLMLTWALSPLLMGCSAKPNASILDYMVKAMPGQSTDAGYSASTLGLSDLSSFDVYVDNDQVVHIIASGKSAATDRHTVIRYIRSEDGGHHWSDAVNIDRFPTVSGKRGNDIQLAASGRHLVALWQTEGELPGMGPMITAISSDHGKTWRTGVNPAVNDQGNQAYIDVIADQHGTFHVTWLEDPEENGHQSLRYARSSDHGKHWSSPMTLDDSTCSCCWNTLALSSRYQLHVLYRDMVPRDMLLMQSSDGGQTWRKASIVGDFQWYFEGCPHIGGGLKSVESNGFTHLHGIVWTGAEERAGLYHVTSSNHGQSWSTPQKLGDMATNGDIAALSGLHSATLAAIWNEVEPGGTRIFLSKSTNGGYSWSTPQRLSEPRHSPTHPRVVATRHGFLALWTEKNASNHPELAWYAFE